MSAPLKTRCDCGRRIGEKKVLGQRVCDTCYKLHKRGARNAMRHAVVSAARSAWQRVHWRTVDLCESPNAYRMAT